jgi:hypothetical protein
MKCDERKDLGVFSIQMKYIEEIAGTVIFGHLLLVWVSLRLKLGRNSVLEAVICRAKIEWPE